MHNFYFIVDVNHDHLASLLADYLAESTGSQRLRGKSLGAWCAMTQGCDAQPLAATIRRGPSQRRQQGRRRALGVVDACAGGKDTGLPELIRLAASYSRLRFGENRRLRDRGEHSHVAV